MRRSKGKTITKFFLGVRSLKKLLIGALKRIDNLFAYGWRTKWNGEKGTEISILSMQRLYIKPIGNGLLVYIKSLR